MSSSTVKFAALFATLVVAAFTGACGGGGGAISANPAPTPTSGPYSATSLSGTYAFEMSGQDGGGFFARVGSFVANGSGGITSGVLDLSSGIIPGVRTLTISSGTYTIGTNGKGSLSFVDSAGETIQLSIVMTSATDALVTETDGSATASGNFTVQDPTALASFPDEFPRPLCFRCFWLGPQWGSRIDGGPIHGKWIGRLYQRGG